MSVTVQVLNPVADTEVGLQLSADNAVDRLMPMVAPVADTPITDPVLEDAVDSRSWMEELLTLVVDATVN